MALRMAAASRVIGMRRGCRTIAPEKGEPNEASTSPQKTSIVTVEPGGRASPRGRGAARTPGNSPWISVSADPMVMTRKPQKMKKWYLLPIALHEAGARRLAGMVGLLDDLLLAEEVAQHRVDASRAADRSPIGSSGQQHPYESSQGPGEHREGGGEQQREERRVSWGPHTCNPPSLRVAREGALVSGIYAAWR